MEEKKAIGEKKKLQLGKYTGQKGKEDCEVSK